MKPTIHRLLTSTLVLILTLTLILSRPALVLAGTNVGGTLASSTTWTAANSPYIVTSDLVIAAGVTLNIEPGVTVKFAEHTGLTVNGTLIAQGTTSAPITFTSNLADPDSLDWKQIAFSETAGTTMDATGAYVSGSLLQFCIVEYAGYWSDSAIDAHSLLIDHCTVRHNWATGIAVAGTSAAPGRITNNTVNNNRGDYGGGIDAEYCTVSGNTVSGNKADEDGGGIYARDSTISDNVVSDCEAGDDGGGIYGWDSAINNNTVIGNHVEGVHEDESTMDKEGQGGGIHGYHCTVNDNTVGGNYTLGDDGDGGGIYAKYCDTVNGNTVISNGTTGSSASGGGIFSYESPTDDNIVSGNTTSGSNSRAGGLYLFSSIARRNVIESNHTTGKYGHGGGIYASDSQVISNTITLNTITGQYARGSGAYLYYPSSFLYNSVTHNTNTNTATGGVCIDDSPHDFEMTGNNLYGHIPHDVVLYRGTVSDVAGHGNYWGASGDIEARIYDKTDDSSLGQFLYEPPLSGLSTAAPCPPPYGLTADFEGEEVDLSWEAVPGTGAGYGYRVYYDSDGPLAPLSGTNLAEGSSPIDAGSQTAITLTGLDPHTSYHIAVTAYDAAGHESWYSNVIWRAGGYYVYLPGVLRQ